MDTGKTRRQMFDVINVKLPLVISLWKVSCFILSGRPIWHLHLKSGWNVISTQDSYRAGRSPGKLSRLKKENTHLKIKFTIHFWSCQQAGWFETVARSRRIEIYFKTSGVLCHFIWVMFQNSQPLKFRLVHAVLYNIWRMRTNPIHGNQFQPLSFPAKAVIHRFNYPFIPPKYCPLLLRAGFHW